VEEVVKPFRVVFAVVLTLVLAAPAAAQVLPDNRLIRVAGTTPVYRVVGGAPIWLSDCAYIPEGCSGTVTDIASLAGYAAYPRDGVTIRNYVPAARGAVYRFAGGAPLWLGICDARSPCPEQYQVDYESLNPARFSHARQYPLDGTVVRNVDDNAFYRFAGGAPLVTRCSTGAGCVGAPTIDNGTIEHNGTNGITVPHLRQLPPDGTTLRNLDDGSYWRVAGGAPLRLGGCGGCAAVDIDNQTLELNGTATASMPHLRSAPPDGTYLTTGARTFRVAGGAAIQLADCGPLGGCPGAVPIDDGTISGLGGGRLAATPKDGTVLRGLPSKQLWEIIGGKRRQTFANVAGVIDVDDGAIAAIPVDSTQVAVPILTPAFTPLITGRYNLKRHRTRFTALSVRNLPTGAKVVITCTGKHKGCPYKKKTYKKFTKGRVDAIKPFRKARLKAKAVVRVTVTSAAGERKITKWTMRATKLPKRSDSCAPAGTRLKRC
jgi:hypothetical protein